MSIFKRKVEFFILLMLFWVVLNGYGNIRMIIYGVVFSIVIIWMTSPVLFDHDKALLHLPSLWRFIWFGGIVFLSIVKSSLLHVMRIMRNQNTYRTFQVALTSDNVIINTLIANAITMTPGTITVDLEDNLLTIVGFAESEDDIEALTEEIMGYEKPFIFRR